MHGEFHYVYSLQSLSEEARFYVGMTDDLPARLMMHTAGGVAYTSRFRAWRIETAIAFRSREKAAAFEWYLKSHSGRAFARKHL